MEKEAGAQSLRTSLRGLPSPWYDPEARQLQLTDDVSGR